MSKFADATKAAQITWRRKALANQEPGEQNKRFYDHILPRAQWKLGLWPKIAVDLPDYLHTNRIRRHTGSHNLCSSWVLCANLYFPFRGVEGRNMLAGFLNDTLSKDIASVTAVELEWEHKADELRPAALLGEEDGGRGVGQTSPDVGLECVMKGGGKGIILVECKYTEHSFYRCSGRKLKPDGRPPNPDLERCRRALDVVKNPDVQCHLNSWGRRYWDYLASVANQEEIVRLGSCPAAFGGYQLFRQQAMAEALARQADYDLVISAVAYDERNTGLMRCLQRTTKVADIKADWSLLFNGSAKFATFTHQSWLRWVCQNDPTDAWSGWCGYVADRYGLA